MAGDKAASREEVKWSTHVFELGNLANYRPASRKVAVKDTTALEPLEIKFFRKDD